MYCDFARMMLGFEFMLKYLQIEVFDTYVGSCDVAIFIGSIQ